MVPIGARVRTALQINMHPLDVAHVLETLPHQLRVWRGQVDRVVITLDTRDSRTGRYHAANYAESRERLLAYLHGLAAELPFLAVDIVDYSPEAREAVRQKFFADAPVVPEKAFDGGPFHVYFHGLLRANADYVLHMDSDMLFGGGSASWMDEAIALFAARPQALFICPFPGPPRADGTLDPALHAGFPGLRAVTPPEQLALDFPAYRFTSVSTRIFLIDMARFEATMGSLQLVRPDSRRRLRARLFGQLPLSMPAEEVLSVNMARRGLERIDMLGSGPGVYSLHPPYRNPAFYRLLPELIARIERGDIPEGQRGDFDINASMIDWSDALRQKTRAKRIGKALRQLLAVNLARLGLSRA